MKRILSTMLSIIFGVTLILPVYADNHFLLSEMTESECIEFVKQNNIEIPNDYEEAVWGPFIKQIISTVEKNPDCCFQFNYTITQAFADNIKRAVNEYYGISQTNINMNIRASTIADIVELKYSTPITQWLPDYANYNCYIFSIGIPEKVYQNPGYFSNQAFSLLYTVQGIADLVCDDLMYLHHGRIMVSAEVDLSNLCTNEQVICVRKGLYDYHFMVYYNESWYHKPGTSAILRYLHTPSEDPKWTNEGLFMEGLFAGDTVYDSDIYFISYDGHDWEYTTNNNGTHIKSCSICGDVFTINCNLTYSSNESGHQGNCSDCGYTTPTQACTYSYSGNGDGTHEVGCTFCDNSTVASCTGVLTHYEDETLGDAHKLECRDCGNDMGGTGEACTIEYVFIGTIDDVNHHARFCTECGYRKTANLFCVYVNSDYCRFCGVHKDRLQAVALHL